MDFNCAICFEDIINYNDKKTLDCEHMYHKNCINQVQNNKCPLCNERIIDDKLKEYENLYLDICKQLELKEIENEELKEIVESDEFLKDINDYIAKSIKANNYTKDIKNHYNIKKSLIPFYCKYCDFKTGKFGYLYNHMNKDHYEKLTPITPAFTSGNTTAFGFGNDTSFTFGNFTGDPTRSTFGNFTGDPTRSTFN